MRTDMSASESLSKKPRLTAHPHLERAEKTRNPVPPITYPEELPVSAKRDDIARRYKIIRSLSFAAKPVPARRHSFPKSVSNWAVAKTG